MAAMTATVTKVGVKVTTTRGAALEAATVGAVGANKAWLSLAVLLLLKERVRLY